MDGTLLITGGTGSFGNAVLRRFLATGHARDPHLQPRREEAGRHAAAVRQTRKLKFYIGDVRDSGSVRDAHAAVSTTSFTPRRSSRCRPASSTRWRPSGRTSLGAENVLERGDRSAACKRVIVLSTDKAVYPINAMGISKAMMEKVMVAKSRESPTGDDRSAAPATATSWPRAARSSRCSSSRSETAQPLTVTDPNMTRFMMSLDDAVDLVLYAFEHGRPGDIFVQKAPAATIDDAGAGADRAAGTPGQPGPGHRHAARREALRDAADPRGDGQRARTWATTTASRRTSATSTTASTSPRASTRISPQDDYNSHNTERLDVRR